MPKTKVPPPPLSVADRNDFLRVLRDATEPLEAAKVAKLAMTSRRPSADEATAVLEQFVSEGALNAWPAKTAKGKSRYWDRDLISVGSAALAELVQHSSQPVSTREVKKLWKLPFKLSDSEIASILAELAKSGTIHEIPAKTAKSGMRYWHSDVVEFGRDLLLTQINDKPPLTKSKLKTTVKWLDQTQFEELVQRLTSRKEIYCHPPLWKSKHFMWSPSPPAPEPYLKGIRDQLATVVKELQSASVPQADLRRAAVQMLESVGISFGAASSVTTDAAAGGREEAVDLLALMQIVEPSADRGVLVAARVLRAAAKIPKAEFDTLTLQLSRQGKIALHEHDFVGSLSCEERDELVTDGHGNYYVGMALRPGQAEL